MKTKEIKEILEALINHAGEILENSCTLSVYDESDQDFDYASAAQILYFNRIEINRPGNTKQELLELYPGIRVFIRTIVDNAALMRVNGKPVLDPVTVKQAYDVLDEVSEVFRKEEETR